MADVIDDYIGWRNTEYRTLVANNGKDAEFEPPTDDERSQAIYWAARNMLADMWGIYHDNPKELFLFGLYQQAKERADTAQLDAMVARAQAVAYRWDYNHTGFENMDAPNRLRQQLEAESMERHAERCREVAEVAMLTYMAAVDTGIEWGQGFKWEGGVLK